MWLFKIITSKFYVKLNSGLSSIHYQENWKENLSFSGQFSRFFPKVKVSGNLKQNPYFYCDGRKPIINRSSKIDRIYDNATITRMEISLQFIESTC